jgi:hypothetical protein
VKRNPHSDKGSCSSRERALPMAEKASVLYDTQGIRRPRRSHREAEVVR